MAGDSSKILMPSLVRKIDEILDGVNELTDEVAVAAMVNGWPTAVNGESAGAPMADKSTINCLRMVRATTKIHGVRADGYGHGDAAVYIRALLDLLHGITAYQPMSVVALLLALWSAEAGATDYLSIDEINSYVSMRLQPVETAGAAPASESTGAPVGSTAQLP